MRLDTLPVQPKDLAQEGEKPTPIPVAKPNQINLAAMPVQPFPVEVPTLTIDLDDEELPSLTAAEKKSRTTITLSPDQQAVFEKQVELFTNELVVGVYGQEQLDEFKEAIKNQTFFVSRAPRAVAATAVPFYSLAFEIIDQGRNLLVSAKKGEEFDFREQRLFSELIPDSAPTALKVSASLGETLIDIAIVGGVIKLAKEGTLTETLKIMLTKLDKAGVDISRHKITKIQVVNAAKNTSMEDAMRAFIHAKKTDLRMHPSRQLPAGKSTIKTPVAGKEVEILRPAAVERPVEVHIAGPKGPQPPVKAGEVVPLALKPLTLEERAAKAKTAFAFITSEEELLQKTMKGLNVSLSGDTKRQLVNVFNKAHPDKPPTSDVLPTEIVSMPDFKEIFAPIRLFTSQSRTIALTGLRDIVGPVFVGKTELDLELRAVNNQIQGIVNKLKEDGQVTPPTMARLLNKVEDAPTNLEGIPLETFQYFRSLTRETLKRVNEQREKTGRKPIKGIQAYFRHISKRTAEQFRAGEIKLPRGLQEWVDKNVRKEIRNPMEIHRKFEDAVLDQFSDDLVFVMTSMMRTALTEIHMDAPLKFFKMEMDRLAKEMPAPVRDWANSFVKEVLLGEQNALDAGLDRTVNNELVKPALNKILANFGTQLSNRPVTELFAGVSRLPIYGALGGVRPKAIFRNLTQTLQNIALYGIEATWKGQLPTNDFPVLERLKKDSLFLRAYTGLEEMPTEFLGKVQRVSLAAYQMSALHNANTAMNAAYHWLSQTIQDPAKKGLGWASPLRTYTEGPNEFYPEELKDLIFEMEYGAQSTQYLYLGPSMPEVFRYKALAPFTRLQSWWMNHIFMFEREAVTRVLWGHTGYDRNKKLTVYDRLNWFKYLLIMGAVTTKLGYESSFGGGVLPDAPAPTAQVALGLYMLASNQGEGAHKKRKRAEATRMITQGALIHIPYYLAAKDLTELLSGQVSFWDYITYNKPKQKTGASLF